MLWNISEKKFIVYGDNIEKEYEFRDNYLVLNVGDYYEDLTNETMLNIIKEIRNGNLPKNGSLKGRNSAEPPIFEKKI
jgi:hypothetical protein